MIKMFAISYNEKRRIKSLFKMSYKIVCDDIAGK